MHSRSVGRIIPALIGAALLIGCPADKPKDATTSAPDEKPQEVIAGPSCGDTPEATFKTLQDASASKDRKKVFSCMDPGHGDQILFGTSMIAGFMGMGRGKKKKKEMEAELKTLLDQHGVVQLEKPLKKQTPAAVKAAATKMFGTVEDKPQLYQDLSDYMEKHAKKGKNGMKATDYSKGELKNLKVDGDGATAKMVVKGRKRPSKLKFVKHEDEWYLAGD